MAYRDEDDVDDGVEEKVGGGAILSVILLVIAVLMLVFLFRDELGIGTPEVDITIPEDIGVEAPPPVIAPDEAPTDNIMDNAIMDAPTAN
ncbi:hypothetical protein [Sphingomicrobium flavum]|uniref:hypothetical protein n=1 Tax=Sphingomicrobium flavum TaxID=1229164 RepID=UPI0021AE04A3|nr:hypothetical protein [Sphingomicrobium flavum]